MPSVTKIDPYDVEALEKSVNDSATRVSTIWVSFLIFSLYLLIAATTVEHRQFLLAEPVKLPALNIEIPLWGFFWLAPILFFVFHTYVLLQVLLLGRTAAAYTGAVARQELNASANAAIRQRLANTLFAQIFAGSPRERSGWLGWLLRAMAWLTLAIAPVLILLAFQIAFLPYHSHIATWTHRLLILLELIAVLHLWPLVLDGDRDISWKGIRAELLHLLGLMLYPIRRVWWLLFDLSETTLPRRDRLDRRPGSRWRSVLFAATGFLFVAISLSFATFPGELHVNLFTGQPLTSTGCGRWLHDNFTYADLRFDRLILPESDIVDDEKLAKFEIATAQRKQRAYQGERLQKNTRGRNFSCGDFSNADFRRIDLTETNLSGANLLESALDGASLKSAWLQDALLTGASLRGALLDRANLKGASLVFAELQGASLNLADAQGASFASARLQGASLQFAKLQGADFRDATMQGAWLVAADMRGALFDVARIQGANLGAGRFEGASFKWAQLQGADLTLGT